MTTLPTGIPRLDALVRAEAGQRTAGLLYHMERGLKARIDSATSDAQRVYWQAALDDIPPPATAVIDAFDTLLRDLTRPESRDWAVRAGADLQHLGNMGRLNAPYYEETRDHWLSMRESPADLAQALAAVCRDG